MTGHTRHTTGPLRNKAQEERAVEGSEIKKIADTPSLADQETWDAPLGHSGTRRAWALSLSMLAAFILGAIGLTVGPRVLLWIGVAAFVLLGAFSLATRTWTDYVGAKREKQEEEAEENRGAAP
ncbi:hypothetical protein KDK95_22660 [Actinospica sp. MGRD01-02]|uniref:Uncharacterized protein n=1 Tax=Actinospica acidithermotolerans TaxID=2828514 RepID=A0A941ED55_9ACTN|nr:hypothetical protein [Actinospica acidithermotolerans]MBR7829127.1 hypothetical protein [Actinospica acidithermotolerans]